MYVRKKDREREAAKDTGRWDYGRKRVNEKIKTDRNRGWRQKERTRDNARLTDRQSKTQREREREREREWVSV